jgi:hypothetical protein
MMKLMLVVLVALVAMVTADTCDELTALKVKAQWSRAYAHGHSREHFAVAVWRTVFNINPDIKERLEKFGSADTNSGKFRAFALRTIAGVDIAVTFLDDPEGLKADLERLHQLAEQRHVPDSDIDTFMKALGHVVPAQLGRCWDKDAWIACFTNIADGIKGHH